MSPFIFETVWRKGKDHAIPDALSRAPVDDPSPPDCVGDTELELHVQRAVIASVRAVDPPSPDSVLPPQDSFLEDLRQQACAYPDYQTLLTTVQNGFPSDYQRLPQCLQPFWAVHQELSAMKGLVLKVHG